MSVTAHIESLKSLNANGSFTTLPVIPKSLTDGTYNATLPTLTVDTTIVLSSGADFTGDISIAKGKYIKSFVNGNDNPIKIIGVSGSNNAILLGDISYDETRVFTQILRVPYNSTDSSYPDGGYSLGTSAYPWTKIYGTTIYENGAALSSKYQQHAEVEGTTLKLL